MYLWIFIAISPPAAQQVAGTAERKSEGNYKPIQNQRVHTHRSERLSCQSTVTGDESGCCRHADSICRIVCSGWRESDEGNAVFTIALISEAAAMLRLLVAAGARHGHIPPAGVDHHSARAACSAASLRALRRRCARSRYAAATQRYRQLSGRIVPVASDACTDGTTRCHRPGVRAPVLSRRGPPTEMIFARNARDRSTMVQSICACPDPLAVPERWACGLLVAVA